MMVLPLLSMCTFLGDCLTLVINVNMCTFMDGCFYPCCTLFLVHSDSVNFLYCLKKMQELGFLVICVTDGSAVQ